MDDLAALCKANELANLYGLDTISLGGSIAWALEMFELGKLTEEDTGGLQLRWGDGAMLVDLIGKVARREGFGALLAEGALRAARKIGRGTEQYVVHVKGLEVAMHDPRGMLHMRKNYPVTPTGGDHTGASEHRTSIRNTAGVCQFLKYDEPRLVDIVAAVTGWDVTEAELEEVGRRGLTMARLFNLREGMTRDDDRLPWRLHQPLAKGPLSTYSIPKEEVDQIVTDYYTGLGWDSQTGVPVPATIERLGLLAYAS
jgi:aldehyde:ferredoxin oxidoreductase